MGQIANQALIELIYKLKNMGKENEATEGSNDFSGLNHLPAEVKQLVVQGQTLVNETKRVLADKNYFFDMTSKNQLKTDCKRVEKLIRCLFDGKSDEKTLKELNHAVICLQTTLEGVVQFFSR